MRGQAKHVPMVSRLASFRVAEGRVRSVVYQPCPVGAIDPLLLLLLIDTEDELSDDITNAVLDGCGPRDGRWTRDAFNWLVEVVRCPANDVRRVLTESRTTAILVRMGRQLPPAIFTHAVEPGRIILFLGKGVRVGVL